MNFDARIQVFCKAPVPGEVKTRLIPDLGEESAAALHERLASRTIDLCQKAELAPVQIWCAPDPSHDFFARVADQTTCLYGQQGEDLGERMLNSARYALDEEGADAAVIVGTDCPAMDADYLRLALEKLRDHDAVIGPAEDGGYCLIGLRRADANVRESLFKDIAWGSDTVCADTCRALNRANLYWALLPLLWDVDRPEDLARLNGAEFDQASGTG